MSQGSAEALAQRAANRLAAVLFDRDHDVDAAVRAFVAFAREDGARVAGFLQEQARAPGVEPRDVFLRDIETGARISILQNLGPGASGCRIREAWDAFAGELYAPLAPDLAELKRWWAGVASERVTAAASRRRAV